ncbi:MAG: phosphoribosylformylglycinamidine cyclo-ligase, partial [Bryobacteraceae bacterium]|nr:phosphoribosylformylglycinamidine cyclo-ligase [Bryobacteraceae bacterium]
DLAGFIVGAVEQDRMLTGDKVQAGDVLIGLPSTGLHTNGYSLARKLLFDVAGYKLKTFVPELDTTVGEELLKVHRSYLKPLQQLQKANILKAAAHITGGGITDNTPRVIPRGLAVDIQLGSWPVPPIFELLKRLGRMSEDDYRRTFNLGIGMVLVVGKQDASKARRLLDRLGETYYEIGVVRQQARGKAKVVYR